MEPDPTMKEDSLCESLSSLRIYIGIPTQNFRPIQATLVGLVGEVLQLPRAVEPKEPKQIGKQPIEKLFLRLIPGASSYTSLFGYWSDRSEGGKRIDDHCEVIEFLMSPEDHAAVVTFVLLGVALPGVFLARQSEILLCISHQRTAWQVSVSRKMTYLVAVAASPRPPQGGAASPPAVESREILDPLMFLDMLLRLQLRSVLDNKGGYLPYLFQEFKQWIERNSSAEWTHYLDSGDLIESSNGRRFCLREHVVIKLPILRTWLLVETITMWLMWAGSRFALKGAEAFETKQERQERWLLTAGQGRELLRSAAHHLEHLQRSWLTPAGHEGYFKGMGATVESDDPMPNAVFWLAFLHDYAAECLSGSDTNQLGMWPRPPQVAKDIIEDPKLQRPAVAPPQNGQLFASLARSYMPEFRAPADRKDTFKEYLARLKRFDERNLPDNHLISAWEMLFRLLDEANPFVVVGGPARFSVRTKLQADSSDPDQWWIETARQWDRMHERARLLVAPILVEALFEAGRLQHQCNTLAEFLEPRREEVTPGGEPDENELADFDPKKAIYCRVLSEVREYLPVDAKQLNL